MLTSSEILFEIINKVKNNPLLDGITLSGGDPLLQVEGVIELSKKCKQLGLNVVCYTGFTFEELKKFKDFDRIVQDIDYLIDGRYVDSLRDLSLKYRGSSNQRIIDIKKSLSSGQIILCEF